MKAVIQRVKESSVSIDGRVKSNIGQGLLVLLGIVDSDETVDIDWLSNKIVNLRIFDDAEGIMNKSVRDINGEILVISQFTLHASTKKGNRPSYLEAAKPKVAIPIYEAFLARLESNFGKQIMTGEFGANMQVALVNDGPVTIIIDTKRKE